MASRIALADCRRILLVCTRRIGDVLLTTPLARTLKRAWPQARLDMLVFAGTEGVLEGNPDVDTVITVPARARLGERLAQVRQLWRRYDLALTPVPSDRALSYCWFAGKRRLTAFDMASRRRGKTLLVHDWVAFDDLDTHTVAMALRLAEQLELPLHYEVVPPSPRDGGARLAAALAPLRGERYAVLHPSPKFRYKMWRRDAWVELAQWLHERGLRVVLSGGPDADERAYVAAIAAPLGQSALDLSGALSLAETAQLIRGAKLFVGPDTAATHIAAATGTPTIALFGPSNPVKWGPWPADWRSLQSPWPWRGGGCEGNVTMIQGIGDCVPCRLEGCDRHIDSDSRCLLGIDVAQVIEAAERALGATAT